MQAEPTQNIGREVADKRKITWPEHPAAGDSGRQVGPKCTTMRPVVGWGLSFGSACGGCLTGGRVSACVGVVVGVCECTRRREQCAEFEVCVLWCPAQEQCARGLKWSWQVAPTRPKETNGRQAGDCGQRTHKGLETVGNKREPSVKSCGQSTHNTLETAGGKWETSVRSCGQSTHHRVETVGDKWETSVKSCGQRTHKGLETVGDKCEISAKSCDQSTHKCKIIRPKHPQETGDSGAQVGDKWETSVKSCGHSNHSVAGTQAQRQM